MRPLAFPIKRVYDIYKSFIQQKDKIVGKKNTIIEINGRRYDAHTGHPLDGHSAPVTSKPVVKSIPVRHHPSTGAAHHAISHAKHHRQERKAAASVASHPRQRSKTLMRAAVAKPSPGAKRHIKVQARLNSSVTPSAAAIETKLSVSALDDRRVQRADHVKRSRLIRHFNPNQPDGISYGTFLPPVGAPTGKSKPAFEFKQPAPAPPKTDMFERAIEHATSHLEPPHKAHKKRRVHLGRKPAKHARA